jgi:hypothetical protein
MHSPAKWVSRHLVTPRQLVRLVNPAIPGKGLRGIYEALSAPTPALFAWPGRLFPTLPYSWTTRRKN